MATPRNSRTTKSWLDGLQQESWQLELVISGFSIFLLIGGWGWLRDLEYDLVLAQYASRSNYIFNVLYYVLRTAYLALLGCLLAHVVLRGLWIAAVGLRSVSGDIQYYRFRFSEAYLSRLQRRTGTFDDYILRLERNCSVFFSLAFLILFCFLSIATWSIASIVFQRAYLWAVGATYQGTGVLGGAGFVSLLVFVMGLLYMIDFVTLGLLKRIPFVRRVYYPVYVLMGWVTLARFYRPLYYNLIDNRFGRRLAIALPFIVVGILVAVSVRQVRYAYFPAGTGDGAVWVDHNNYDDEDPNLYDRVWRTSLASKYVRNNYIEAFVPYRPARDDERLLAADSTLKVSQYVGTKLSGAFVLGERFNPNADYPQLLAAFSRITQLSINDSIVSISPHFHFHPERRQPGILYVLPTHHLPVGEHRLSVRVLEYPDDGSPPEWSSGRTIYFYK